ncbi:dysbindin-A-like [Anarhichas minor]|uniref:dysbindin-A-like n=1 Tax=Anarhichas minor TaxID=65739 RepID=UPI003F736D7A
MESRLVYLETLCCQCEQQTVKQHHVNQLEVYKKKKRREMEVLEVELNSEHAQKVTELEQAMQQKLKERQKVYEEAFNQDVQQYLSTGFLQHRGKAVCSFYFLLLVDNETISGNKRLLRQIKVTRIC